MPIELLVEAAEDDRLLVDVLLPQGRAVRVCLEVLARVVQVIASPASGKTKYYVNAAYCYEGYSYFRFRWSYGEPRFIVFIRCRQYITKGPQALYRHLSFM